MMILNWNLFLDLSRLIQILFYQEYEDTIDSPLISMIQQGFIKLNQAIKDDFQGIDKRKLLYSSILGLVYVTGLRPV